MKTIQDVIQQTCNMGFDSEDAYKKIETYIYTAYHHEIQKDTKISDDLYTELLDSFNLLLDAQYDLLAEISSVHCTPFLK